MFPRILSHRYVPVRRHQASGLQTGQMGMDQLFDQLFAQVLSPFAPLAPRKDGAPKALLPRLGVTSDEQSYTVSAELPGVSPEAISLEVQGDSLIIKGEKREETVQEGQEVHVSERSFGAFERVLTLPEDALPDGIRASHKDGVLTVSIPRQEPAKPESRTIEITRE